MRQQPTGSVVRSPGVSIAFVIFLFAAMFRAASAADAESLLKKMQQKREAIRSAVVRIKGTKHLRENEENPAWEGTMKGSIEFDKRTSDLRLEWEETYYTQNVPAPATIKAFEDTKSVPATRFNHSVQFIRNPEYTAYYTRSGESICSSIAIFGPDLPYVTGRRPSIFHRNFDPLACNLIDFQTWRDGPLHTDPYETLLKLKPTTTDTLEHAIKITCSEGTGRPVIEILVKPEGLVPVEYIWFDEPSGARFQSKSTWKVVEGHHVPQSYDFVWDFPAANDYAEYHMKMEWTEINKSIPAERFECQSFVNVMKGVHLVDHRDPTLPYLGEVGPGGVIPVNLIPRSTDKTK
jgi:hypothetical protein